VIAAVRTLGIPLTVEALDAAVRAAERESLSHLEFLHRLLFEPAEARRQRALERRIRAAKFRELTTLEGFDWAFNVKGLDRRAIEQLVTCDFSRRRENVILVGQTGLGKSRILQAVGPAACVLGYRVRYATSAKLLQEFTAALADGSFGRMLEDYARFDLLLIDEFGLDRLERQAQSQTASIHLRLTNYLEQRAVYDAYNFLLGDVVNGRSIPANTTVMATAIPGYLCPSDPNPGSTENLAGGFDIPVTTVNYAVNGGVNRWNCRGYTNGTAWWLGGNPYFGSRVRAIKVIDAPSIEIIDGMPAP
jgi:DNA replication protein DnaC